jgi:hypothetical protein
VRIKILTEEGKKNADVKINYWHEDDFYDLEAASYSPEGEEFELDSDNIFEEESGKLNSVSFALPGVKVGSVIEWEYTIYSDYITNLKPWYFQSENYTLLSQLSITIPRGFSYNTLKSNFDYYDVKERVEESIDPDNRNFKLVHYYWTGRDIPAIKEEPYTDSIDDKYVKMIFLLDTYKSSFQIVNFGKTWDTIAERISRVYDNFLEEGGLTETVLKDITLSDKDELGNAKAIYDYVCSEIKTTPHNTLFGDEFKAPNSVLTDKTGSSSEKNMLLINLLIKAGLNPKPILISTRSHGKVIPYYCEPSQFNRLICFLKIDKNKYYLNTYSKFNEFGHLPPLHCVGAGLLVDGDKASIVEVKPIRSFHKVEISTVCDISEDLLITGETEFLYSGYEAIRQRRVIDEEDVEEHVKDLLKEVYEEAVLDTFVYIDAESKDKPLKLTIKYSLPDYIEEGGDLLYFPLQIFSSQKENPFTEQSRLYNIEYNYKIYKYERTVLNWPDNFIISEVPENRKAELSEIVYRKSYSTSDNSLKCSRSLNLKNRIISSKYYNKLKDMYDLMVLSDQEQVVLNMSNLSTENPAK